ncbi:MAG: enoyl-CoA hydratase/isomerase family protein [Fidelibacterota bacterium]|nr:MAG: enoyl-CoA hydratase/isomerase family protein [Candidatus Neomarinimicrobiota bacterium]
MTNIQSEHHHGILTLALNRGITNAINAQVIAELTDTLQSAQSNPEVNGIVLTSANDKFFSIGLDIPELYPLDPDNFMVFYKSFNQVCLALFTFPKPMIAAITGHATAGGCILALCCDYRYIAEGRNVMGLNEIKLGVPVPYPADCILRSLVGHRNARDIMNSGDFYQPEEALQLGLVDMVLAPDKVRSAASETIATLGSYDSEAFGIIKQNRVNPIAAEVRAQLDAREQVFVELWYAEETRRNLTEAMAKF